MKLAAVLTMCALASATAACGRSDTGAATGACGAMARELAGARGATPRDQARIDATLEAMIRARCITRAAAAAAYGG